MVAAVAVTQAVAVAVAAGGAVAVAVPIPEAGMFFAFGLDICKMKPATSRHQLFGMLNLVLNGAQAQPLSWGWEPGSICIQHG